MTIPEKKYTLYIDRKFYKDLTSINTIYHEKIIQTVFDLEINPRPYGYKQLKGFKNLFRIRVGDYRIIYNISEEIITVTILKASHRKNSYRF